MDCLFCKIAAHEIPSKKAYEDDKVYAFYDIDPQAPKHVLVIPKKHIDSLDTIAGEEALAAHMLTVAAKIARELGIDRDGYRVVTNIGEDGGQSVKHLHLHILGGRSMKWPPG